MPHNNTRQRQGRDFPKHLNDDSKRKSVLDRLEQYKEEAERNAVPVDGHEPPRETPAPERGRW